MGILTVFRERAENVTSLYSLAHLRDLPTATWDALVPAGQPFLRHAFLSAMEDSGSVARNTGWAAEHLVLERGGQVRALLPAYRKWHSFGEYVFDHGWADACERAGIAYYPNCLALCRSVRSAAHGCWRPIRLTVC